MGGVTVLFLLAAFAMQDINPSGTQFYDCDSSPLRFAMDISNGCSANSNFTLRNASSSLPTSESGVSPTTGNIFVDTFTSAKQWFKDVTGISFIQDLFSVPAQFLLATGMPPAFAYVITGLWGAIMIFLIAAWLLGR